VRGVDRLAVVSRLAALFEHSPSIDALVGDDWRAVDVVRRFRGTAAKPIYYLRYEPPVYDVPANVHIITTMCWTVGIRGRVALRTYLPLTQAERADGRIC